MNNCSCAEVLFNLNRLTLEETKGHMSQHMQLSHLITDSLSKRNGRCQHLFAKIKGPTWSVQRRQHTLCKLTSCAIDVMPSFSWFQICPLTAIDKSGISACADIWRGAALEQSKPCCKLYLSLTTWVAVCANSSFHFVTICAVYANCNLWNISAPCQEHVVNFSWYHMGHSVRKCWTLSPHI